MNGQSLISVSAAIRKATGLAAGTMEFFAGLSNSLRRYHTDQITTAKSDDTRQRRIEKAIGLFLAGKQR